MSSFVSLLVSKPFRLHLDRTLRRSCPGTGLTAFCAAAAMTLGLITGSVEAQAKSPTSATLSVTSAGTATTSLVSGSVITLSASVTAGGASLTHGQVNFCEASAKSCTDIHILGTAQLTSTGTAEIKLRPGIGSHSYKAVFLGTNSYSSSSSSTSSLTVTGTAAIVASTTSIGETGSFGKYTLTATVTEAGGTASPSGSVSFLDASYGNAALSTKSLGPGISGIAWPNSRGISLDTTSQAIALGDFNEDGIPDIAAIAGGTSSPLVILLGKADGTYTTAPPNSVSAYFYGPISVADFNADGKQDLAILNGDTNVVTILLGNGDGTFNLAASSPSIPANSTQLAVADFNGDGNPDLAVSSTSTSSLTILLGAGDGTFTATKTSPAASGTPRSLAAGDLNGDGKVDLAVSDLYDDTVTLLLGSGDGTFTPATSLLSGSKGSPITIADVNRDGRLDLIAGVGGPTGGSDSIAISTGNGDGTFTSPSSGTAGNTNSISSVQAGDFNSDGLADLVVTDSSTGTFTVFLNSASGAFTSTTQSVQASPYYQLSLAIGDINGDGRTDLAIGNDDGLAVSVYLTQPTETATAVASLSVSGVGRHLVDASYAGDGDYASSVSGTLPLWGVPPATATTLVLTSNGAQVTQVAPGSLITLTATVSAGTVPVTNGQVNFCDASASECTDIHLLSSVVLGSGGTAAYKFVPGAGNHTYKAVFVQDGYGLTSSSSVATLSVGPAPSPKYSDTAAITYSGVSGAYSFTATVEGFGGAAAPTGNVSFLDTSFGNTSLGTAALGKSTAGLGWRLLQTVTPSSNAVSEASGDFNGDGISDLAILFCDNYGETCSYTILLGNGDGTFKSGSVSTPLTGQSYTNLIAGDFNGDGRTDLALLSWPSFTFATSLTTLVGKGDGTFTQSAPSTVFNQGAVGGDGIPGSMVAADFNNDGKMDVAVVGDYIGSGGVAIVLGDGDGTFTAVPSNSQPAQGFNAIAAGDFNGDGIPDLVATAYFGSGATIVLLGNGDGTFRATSQQLPADPFARSIVTGDFNADGKLDFAIGYNGGVRVLTGAGDGTFTEVSGSPFTNPGQSLVAGDFNQDGKVDLAGVDQYGDQIDLLLGVGDGTFTSTTTNPIVSQSSNNPFFVVAADFNQDGVSDLAMLTRYQAAETTLLTVPTQTATATITGIAPIGAGLHNVEASYAGDSNYGSAVSSTVSVAAGLTSLVISPSAGTYAAIQTVTLSESIPGATIYYSAYGTINTKGFVPYTGPIALNLGGAVTIVAYASETGYLQTDYTIATFNLTLPAAPAPVISPAAGSFPGTQTVTITDTAANATIYYTVDGTYPTINSPIYTGPITVSTSETVAAIATASGYSTSSTASANYYINSSKSSFIYTIAGNQSQGYSGDGGLATTASLNDPLASVTDSAGNTYIADSSNSVIRKVDAATGRISTVAGTGVAGFSGDNGPATNAQLAYPFGLALDSAGNLYIADQSNELVRKVALSTGVITTVAGSPTATTLGDNGPATSAQLSGPRSVVVDSSGNLYISDVLRIRKVDAGTGTITTIAGGANAGYSGDGGPAINATLSYIEGLALDSAGNLYVADTGNNVIRKITAATGKITTVAGTGPTYPPSNGGTYFGGDGGPATSAHLNTPFGVAVDTSGNLYIADTNNAAIREVAAATGIITTIVGHPPNTCSSLSGDGGPAISAGVCNPFGVSVDTAGTLYIADTYSSRIRKVTQSALPPSAATAAPVFNVSSGSYVGPQSVTITDATPGAEIYVTVNGPAATTAGVGYLGPVNVTGSGTLQAVAVATGYLPSAPVSATYTITTPPPSVMSTVAGTGVYGQSGAGGLATSANLGVVSGVAVDSAGNLFLADSQNYVIWKVAADTGTITVAAGTLGYPSGNVGNGGPATSAYLNSPTRVALDAAGNLYIAESGGGTIRKVAAQTGIISVYAGGGNYSSNLGDGQPATSATLFYPQGMAFDAAGNLYIADNAGDRIRKVTASTGIITTVAGGAASGPLGDGGSATAAVLVNPNDVALDSAGNLYIAEVGGRVRFVNQSTGVITTFAGNGNGGASGDGGPATEAEVLPLGLALDKGGNLYISNSPAAIRRVPAGGGVITRVAGTGYTGSGGDGGSATMANLLVPEAIAFDAAGNLYIADAYNYRVRKVTFPAPAATPGFSLASGTYVGAQTVTLTDTTPAAAIYYTTDSSTPTTGSTLYAGPITVSSTETVKAVAVANGYTESGVASADYTIHQSAPGTPSITLSSSQDPSLVSNSLTLTASVTASTGTPSGSVVFFDGTTQLGSVALNAGAATYTTSALSAGSHSITAVYSGDQFFSAATSAALLQVVDSNAVGIPSGGSSSATISAGGQATYTLVVIPPGTGPALSLAVSGLPSGATGTFSPPTIPAGSVSTNVTLTVSVPATAAMQPTEGPFQHALPPVLLGLMVVPFARKFRKASQRWLWLTLFGIVAIGMASGLSGCSSGGSSGSAPTPHTYTLTVTATSGSFSQSIPLTLTVD